jgi:hypothetical protein
MKKLVLFFATIFCATVLAQESPRSTFPYTPDFAPPVAANEKNVTLTTEKPFDANTFSEKFAEHVAKIEQEVKEKKGLALIVRLRDTEGNPIKRGDFHTASHYDERSGVPCFTTDGGFATFNFLASRLGREILSDIEQGFEDKSRPLRLAVYTATNEPAIIELPIEPGNVYYADITLQKTPDDKLVTVAGIMLDDSENPITNSTLHLRVPGGVGAAQGLRMTKTDAQGRFAFEKVTPQLYDLYLSNKSYSVTTSSYIPKKRLSEEHVLYYYKKRNIEIEYVYQPDGSRDFTKGDLPSKTAVLEAVNWPKGFRFATGDLSESGASRTPEGVRDIAFLDDNGKMCFRQMFHGSSGFYDAGAVPFDSIKEASANDNVYPNGIQPVSAVVGHVYVVKTMEGKYAKFFVRGIVE